MKTLVLGIGNLLMGDEGVGIHVIRHLQENYKINNADLLDGGTGGFHLLEYFQQYDRVVLVDATIDGKPPGTINMIKPKYSSEFPPTLTAHDIGLKDLIDSLYLLNKLPEIILFTISINELTRMNLELSDEVIPSIQTTCENILRFLNEN